MFRVSVLHLIALFACLVAVVSAQEAGQSTGQYNAERQVPGPAVLQNRQYSAQNYVGGNYDLPPQSPANNRQQLKITRLTQFPLSVAISQAKLGLLNSVELVYSMDCGQNWYSYQHLPPKETTTFEFNVPQDGEYWFVFRAILKTGKVEQIDPAPAARVLVDTVPPKMTLDARRNPSGEVIVEWTVEDAALKNTPPTVSLSYDSNPTRMTLAADPKNVKRDGNCETGHVAFWPLHDAEVVEIRCEQEDAADNKEIQTKRLVLKPSQNGNTSETAMPPAVDDTTTAVQPVPDITVAPPRPVVMNNTPDTQEVTATGETPTVVASSDTLTDLLNAMGEMTPSAVEADVTQRYGDNYGNDAATSATQPSVPAPSALSAVPPTQYVPTTSPATAVNQTAAPPRLLEQNAGSDAAVSSETASFPGKIVFVSLGQYDDPQFNRQQYIIVRWMPGGTQFADSKVDMYRSETKHGPWRPIVFDLKNTGEHYWPVSAADQMPYYLRVDLRSTQGAYTDFTVHTISLPLSLHSAPSSNAP